MSIIDNLEKMIASGRDDALLHYSLGNEYFKAERWQDAIEQMKRAVERQPDYSAAWKIYGKSLSAAGCHEEALRVFEKGIQVAEGKGDIQAAKEMRVFQRRAQKQLGGVD